MASGESRGEGNDRVSTGLPALDRMLGGGLLPGTLTVVLGATGIGKTQLGIHFCDAGRTQEGERGVLFDLTARGDSQNHREYARRLCGWELQPASTARPLPEDVFDRAKARRDVLHIFAETGRRVTREQLDDAAWKEWKAELNRRLDCAIAFFYGNFAHGVRRCVIDGIEPVDHPADSIQFELFDYVYRQILRKPADWVARDWFRAGFRERAGRVAEHAYPVEQITALMLYTCPEVWMDDLLRRPLQTGDHLANANTIVLMGKLREGSRVRRVLHVAKHRGSACDDRIVPFTITDRGLQLEE